MFAQVKAKRPAPPITCAGPSLVPCHDLCHMSKQHNYVPGEGSTTGSRWCSRAFANCNTRTFTITTTT